VDEDLLVRMRDVMPHRGPDESGVHVHGNVGLAHRRLSIIDLESGQQPLCNEDGTVWITFNGEIFNHDELRDELIAKGHRFKTRSDTEVIVHLYEEEGIDCPKRLRGQFAFGIWDGPRQRLMLARDRLGILPLSYVQEPHRLLFGSEIKVLLADPGVRRDIDLTALVEYMTYDYVPAPRSIFESVRKLPAGHVLVCEKGEVSVRRYWSLRYEEDSETSEEEFLEKVEAKLQEAIRIRLMSEVPLGAFLSGGIDSSLIVALMSEAMTEPVKTFSIGFGEEDFDELKYAKVVADRFGTEHHEFVVTSETKELLPRLVQQFDEPFADPSAIPTYYVCKMAREHVTVCLSGDGGDEAFAGYSRYRRARDLFDKVFTIPTALRKSVFSSLGRWMPYGTPGKHAALLRSARTPAELYGIVKGYTHPVRRNPLLNADVRKSLRYERPYELIENLYEEAGNVDYVSRLQYVDIFSYLPDNILVKTDRTSMLNSLETRVPLLDYQLLELAATTPMSLRMRDGQQKYALKRILSKYLPQAFLDRKKTGFGVPLKYWFERDWKDHTADVLLDPQGFCGTYFDMKKVAALLENHTSKRQNFSKILYRLLVLEEWSRQYLR
jgi:asparagine synthase (glutamine-hydrolysing)